MILFLVYFYDSLVKKGDLKEETIDTKLFSFPYNIFKSRPLWSH